MPSPPSLELTFIRELAGGTFARLYLAEARAPGGVERLVAVKLLREQWNASPDLLARTSDEAQLLARLRHKNIVRVDDTATIDGQFALLMEFVDGVDCKQLVELRGGGKARDATPGPGNPAAAVPPRAALEIAAAAASALDAAHHKVPLGLDHPLQVVHRDIKPSNLMVSADGEVKVLDFGTARFSQDTRAAQTREMRFGSLKYMSPERRDGDRGELAADMYALGIVLLELVRGEWLPVLPLDGAEHDEAIARYIELLPTTGMPNEEWDAAFRQLLRALMAADPAWRPPSGEAARLLKAFAEQALGMGIEAYAGEVIAPFVKAQRDKPATGELVGRRFQVTAPAFDLAAPPDPIAARLVAVDMSNAGPDESATRPSTQPPPSEIPPVPLPVGPDGGEAQFWTRAFAARLPGEGGGTVPVSPGGSGPLPVAASPASPVSASPVAPPRAAPVSPAPASPSDAPPARPRPAEPVAAARPQPVDADRPAGPRPVAVTRVSPTPATAVAVAPPPSPTLAPEAPASPASVASPVAAPGGAPPVEDEVEEPPSVAARVVAVGAGALIASGVLVVLIGVALLGLYGSDLAARFGGAPADAPAAPPAGDAGAATDAGGAAPTDATPTDAPPADAPGAASATPTDAPTANTGDPASAPAATVAQVTVRMPGDSPQWMRIESDTGEAIAKGTGDVSAQLPPGTYRLAIKLVGRPAVATRLDVASTSLTLSCAAKADSSVACTGGGLDLALQ